MSTATSCILYSIKDKNKKILLPHNEAVILGRNKVTGVTDVYISREQMSVQANYNNFEVTAKCLGTNYSECNGYVLEKDQVYHLQHGDIIGLRLGEHKYCVTFVPEQKNNSNSDSQCKENSERLEPETKKPKLNFPIFENAKKLSVKSETNDDLSGDWEEIDKQCLIYITKNFKPTSKIAAFDLDGTLIHTKSGLQFPKNKDDWALWNPVITKKLKELVENGYTLVIFTNQAAIKQDRAKIEEFKEKIANILQKINIPIQIFVSTGKGIYRKPLPGMWNFFIEHKIASCETDFSNSFYVGDAAGRPKNWAAKKKKDHSLADRLFAENIGLKFYTPDEFFLGTKSVEQIKPQFDPKLIPSTSNNWLPSIGKNLEVIVMVGYPGAGKSHFCKTVLVKNGYEYANRDTLGSWQKCAKVVEEALQNKQSVVVDNTNPDKESRKRFIAIANKFNVPCRCFIMNVDINHAKHNNKFRELVDGQVKVTDVIINSYNKQYQEPTLDEGFSDIVRVSFVPQFEDPEKEKLYKMFLLEN